MTHQKIHRFQIDGELLSDSEIPKAHEQFTRMLMDDMRDRGYLPLLDVDPEFSTSYQEKPERWTFLITIHGIYVGKRKAWQYQGLTAGRLVPKSTPNAK